MEAECQTTSKNLGAKDWKLIVFYGTESRSSIKEKAQPQKFMSAWETKLHFSKFRFNWKNNDKA